MGKYRFRLSDMMPNAWFYKLKDMSHSAAARNNHHHHHKKKRRSSSSSISTLATTPSSNIVLHLSDHPTYKFNSSNYGALSQSPRLSDLYSPRNHKASDIPLPSSPTSRISSSSPSILLSKKSKSSPRKSLYMPSASPSPTRRLQTITPPANKASNTCNHHSHTWYYSLHEESSPESLFWDESSNSYRNRRHCHNNNLSAGLDSSDEVGSASSSSCCRISSSTADIIIDVKEHYSFSARTVDPRTTDDRYLTSDQLQLVSDQLNAPAMMYKAPLTTTAGSETHATTITATKTKPKSRKSGNSSKGRHRSDQEIDCLGGQSSSQQQQLSVRIDVRSSEERNNSSSRRRNDNDDDKNQRTRKKSLIKANNEQLVSCPKSNSSSSSRGVKLRMSSRSPRLANKKVLQAQRINTSARTSKCSNNNNNSIKSSRRSSTSLTDNCFAVVKYPSGDPQRDFRESMTEMIVENNIKASSDLEDLLACYLTLNSSHYHQIILKAFEQIWFDIFYLRS